MKPITTTPQTKQVYPRVIQCPITDIMLSYLKCPPNRCLSAAPLQPGNLFALWNHSLQVLADSGSGPPTISSVNRNCVLGA